MPFAAPSSAPARRVLPQHRPWEPWGYQTRAVAHLMGHAAAALFLDPGLGKTACTLAAFLALKERGHAECMLVVAPLRVCQLVWRQEGAKWSQFRELRFSLLHGPKKAARLKEEADVYLVNPEGIPWLVQQFYGRPLPFDIVVIDELTRFKNHRALRSKKLRRAIHAARRRWGLTGSPAPNGYMDLFGQMLMLDDGAALGRHVTHYRDTYFQPSFNGYDWELRRGMAERIEERIAPYVLRMAAEDYLDLPPLRDNVIRIELPPDARAKYRQMERDMVLSLPEGVVTGANSGAVYSKLAQMANGAVYLSERDGEWAEVHGAKLDALEELVEELAGTPLLVGYEFRHDLERIRVRLGTDTPTLSGVSEKRILELEAAWNRGEIPVLLAHPASVAHGLNLQGSAAAHVCWFSRPWDLELVDQFIARVWRQGSTANHVTNHILQVAGTLDDLKAEALAEKDTTQQGLLRRLNATILRDEPAPTAADAARREDTTMVKKLGFRDAANDAGEQSAPPPRPKGWGPPAAEPSAYEDFQQDQQERGVSDERMRQLAGGQALGSELVRRPAEEPVRPKGWGPPAGTEPDEQRAAIRSKITAPPPEEQDDEDEEDVPASVRALQAFGPGIVQQLDGDEDANEDGGGPFPRDDSAFGGTDGHVPGNTTAATETEPVRPKGWSAPAAHAPAETEDVVQGVADSRDPAQLSALDDTAPRSARDVVAASDPWRGVSTRYRNALEAAGYTSAFDAWEAGWAAVSTVDRFGKKGWAELEALYGTGETGVQEAVSTRMQSRGLIAPEPDAARVLGERAVQESTGFAQTDHPSVLINIQVHGLPAAALHALFSTLANRYAEK